MAVVYNQNEQDKDQENKSMVSGGGSAPQSSATPQQNAPNQPQRQGSGRFTNIQKYLSSNQNAGQQLAGSIGSRFSKQNEPLKQKQEDQMTQLNQGIQQGRQAIQQGQGFNQNLRQIGQDIQSRFGGENYQPNQNIASINSFTQSPDFNRFQQIQAGQGVDENLLNLRQQTAQSANKAIIDQNQQNVNMLGSEQGRSDLLRKNFTANPMYTQGQNRLDTLFLTRGGLNPLRQQLNTELQSRRAVDQTLQGTLADVNTLRSQEQGIVQDIDSASKANEQAYLDMLSSYVPKINELRDKEFTDLGSRYGAMKTNNLKAGGLLDPSGPLDKDGNPILQKATTDGGVQRLTAADLKKLGLQRNMQTFNVFDETSLDDVALRGRQAQGFQDVASEGNVAQYGALARIAGLDPSAKRLTQASTLEDTVQARQGESNLQNRLEAASRNFDAFAAGRDYKEHFQPSGKTWAETQGNLQDVLAGKNLLSANRRFSGQVPLQAQSVYNRVLQDLKDQGFNRVLTTEGDIEDILSNVTPTSQRVFTRNAQDFNNNTGLTNLDAQVLRRNQANRLSASNTDLDEVVKQRLENLGIKRS
jgi:hypothetical protein